MRVLHTSDWHLGRVFHGAPLLGDQRRALTRVVDIARAAAVDVVVVAGDVYDRAIPPADAVDLLGDVLGELRATGAVVVAITGNHDSPNRVGALDPLLRAGGVTLRGRFDPAAPVVVPATDGGPDLVVHPVPYQEPLAAGAEQGAAPPGRRTTQHDVMAWALDAVRADLAARGPVRSVVVAHAFVAGAAPSDSERELSVGGVDRVPLDVFDGITYTALGHLHRPQAPAEGLAYSGSLLPYSFSETQPSSVRLVDLAPDGTVAGEVVPLGVERPVVTLEGRLEALLADPAHRAAEGAWVRARLTDEVLPRHAMDRLRDRFPHAVVLEHRAPAAGAGPADIRHRADEVTDLDLALAFLGQQLGRPAADDEAALLAAAFAAVAAGRQERPLVPVAAAGGGPGDGVGAAGAVA
ncbi:MAG TPA: exonuclease SbcCD subunit D [Acidimicrobiales bacterium]|nr:exonuclease SbcCD subunit D [Acidimicrobiales bacterium]